VGVFEVVSESCVNVCFWRCEERAKTICLSPAAVPHCRQSTPTLGPPPPNQSTHLHSAPQQPGSSLLVERRRRRPQHAVCVRHQHAAVPGQVEVAVLRLPIATLVCGWCGCGECVRGWKGKYRLLEGGCLLSGMRHRSFKATRAHRLDHP